MGKALVPQKEFLRTVSSSRLHSSLLQLPQPALSAHHTQSARVKSRQQAALYQIGISCMGGQLGLKHVRKQISHPNSRKIVRVLPKKVGHLGARE